MLRLTLRTLLAYLDDTLPPEQARAIGQKVAESETAQELVDKIRKAVRRRSLSTPPNAADGSPSDPNIVAEYLSDVLPPEQLEKFETTCLESEVNLAEVAAVHQLLTLLVAEPVRVPPTARKRMYQLVTGPESLPNRKPGKTVPVAGELADAPTSAAADDAADASFLLGMKAFSRSDVASHRWRILGLAGGLLAAFGFATWMAWPVESASSRPVAERLVPLPPPPATVKAPEPETVKVSPPATPMVPPLAIPETAPVEVPPMPAKAVADPVEPARADRMPVGKLETLDKLVVSREPTSTRWLRATADAPAISSTDRVLALPGYKAKIALDTGMTLELWGNLPEQAPIPVYESAVTLFAPGDGFDADLMVNAGRVYLKTPRPGGAKVRLRVRDAVWDLALMDAKSDVVVEVVNTLKRGIARDADRAEKPVLSIDVVVLQGSATVRVNAGAELRIGANQFLAWDGVAASPAGPKSLVKPALFKDSPYHSRFPLQANEVEARAVQVALTALAKRVSDRDGLRVALQEALSEEGATYPTRTTQILGMRAAISALAATGDLPPLLDALNDINRPFARDAAAFGLAAQFAANPEEIERCRTRLEGKLGLTPEQSATALRLLHGAAATDKSDGDTLDKLVDLLNDPVLVVRELAFWVLRTDVDPEARGNRNLNFYDAASASAAREPFVRGWRKRVEEIKSKN